MLPLGGPMAESLRDVKTRLGHLYLGKLGIHGLGMRRSENAICIYITPQADTAAQESALREIEMAAAPYKVVTIRSEPPALA